MTLNWKYTGVLPILLFVIMPIPNIPGFILSHQPLSYTMVLKSEINSYDISVIGGGVGGLITSARLANDGHRVSLIEKNPSLGGRMTSETFNQPSLPFGKFRFDVGPSLLLLPDVYSKTFKILNKNIEDYVKILPVEPYYRCFFEEDGTLADISKNTISDVIQQLDDSTSSFQSYMKTATNFLNFGLPAVIEEKLTTKGLMPFIFSCFNAFPLLSHSSILNNFFKSQKVRAMMSFQDLYVGLSPYNAPAVFSLLQALEFDRGIYYPEGGFISVATALTNIALEAGVQIRTSSPVKRFHIDNLRVKSVELDSGEEITSDYFVSNIDAPFLEEELLPGRNRDGRTASGEPSCGVVSISWALDQRIEKLTHHSIFLSKSYEDSWRCVSSSDAPFNPDAFNFYVHAPSRTDSTVCPPGSDAITILVPVPHMKRDVDTADNIYNTIDIQMIKQAVLHRLKVANCIGSDFESHILYENIRSPESWEQEFSLFRGSAFGLAHSISQLSLLRPNIRHPYLKNLYRVGASTRPGNGVPLVMIGARLTSECMLSDFARYNNE